MRVQTTGYAAVRKHDGGVAGGGTYLYVVSFTGILLHRTHLSVSGSNLSTQYPVMGLPPSSSGSHQVSVTASLVMSEGSSRVGGPGGSVGRITIRKVTPSVPGTQMQAAISILFAFIRWQMGNLTKLILGYYGGSLDGLADAIHVFRSHAEDVLFVGR